MEPLTTRVQKALLQEFSPREVTVEAARRGRVDGWVISKSFEKLNDDERYQKVWKLIEASLPEKDRNRILGFFLLTPLEKKFIFDENFDSLENGRKIKASFSKKKTTSAKRKKAARN